MKLFILAAFLLIFASKMAYVWRGRGPKTRGDSNMTSDTDKQDETISDKSQSLLREARFQKKRKLNISGGDSHYKSDLDLHEEPTELVDYESLPT